MPSRLAHIASPAPVIYVASFAACPDSESEGHEEIELDNEGPTIGQSSSNESSTTHVRREPHEKDTTNLNSANSRNPKTSTLTYPDLPEKLPSSTNVQQDYTGYKDGNVRLLIGTRLFLLHEHKLEEFSTLKKKIREARQSGSEPNTSHNPRSIVELCLDEDPQEFAQMVEILYTPIYKHISSNDHLKSTLRLATKFKHPILRSYAIQCLEERNLPPIERIELAQSSNISSWRKEALDELCTQDEPITLAEANILGMKTFVELAHRREDYKSSRKSKRATSDEITVLPQDPLQTRDSENRANLRPRGRPQKNPSGYQARTSNTLRRSTRTNAGKVRAEPYRNHRGTAR
ncbi:unnamed protein product [Rhizoctonia solani]|uniref:BTB domain-containing protein n=1 Tax=Rhizoctonia solani TaxID=456999 RepID=A0A8H3B247_9AGAM|nr:unnamed protein product [Rhizoctonia solani]